MSATTCHKTYQEKLRPSPAQEQEMEPVVWRSSDLYAWLRSSASPPGDAATLPARASSRTWTSRRFRRRSRNTPERLTSSMVHRPGLSRGDSAVANGCAALGVPGVVVAVSPHGTPCAAGPGRALRRQGEP